MTVLRMELASDSLNGKTISLDVQDKKALENSKKNPIIIKEGVEYK